MPSLTDDGRTVKLDLHGARVEEAVRLASATLSLAARRGRRRLDLVHGTSTSDRHGLSPTIKHALHDWIEAPGTRAQYVQAQRGDAVLTLHLDLTRPSDARRITLREVWS